MPETCSPRANRSARRWRSDTPEYLSMSSRTPIRCKPKFYGVWLARDRKACAWQDRQIRPGALFLVGDPKQAIYRFRGADVATYLTAKNALADHDPSSILEISANFRSQPSILQFVNDNFASMLDLAQGQPGFSALAPVRKPGAQSAVATFDITDRG